MLAWRIFTHPVELNAGIRTLLLLLPLCASVVVVYKTIRTRSLRRLPIEVGAAMAYVIGGLIALGIVLWMGHGALT